jgi:predicted esterase
MGRKGLVLALIVALALVVGADAKADPPPPVLDASDVPTTAGPDLLRQPIPEAPSLKSVAPWHAEPILISGAVAYRDGELLYQDYLFDDHGADGARDPSQPQPYGVAVPIGTYTYPTGARYHGNDADLVEVRIRPHGDTTRFRVTFNTLVDADVTAFTIALGDADSPVVDWPDGANVRGPADTFVTVHEGTGETPDGTTVPVNVDLARSQIDVTVPHSVWMPGDGARVALGAGLWGDGEYLVPSPVTSDTVPGGSGAIVDPPAFFNVAFRTSEQIGGTNRYWANEKQALALAQHDMTPFTVAVDFAKLRRHENDESGVRTTGSIDRIFWSQFDLGVGVDLGTSCASQGVGCKGLHYTRLQPYNLYVPESVGDGPLGLTVLLHSLNANYNQYANTRNQSQYGERDQGTLVMTPLARGHDGQYYDYALADVFEVWRDVAYHYDLEPEFTSIGGYSMGGYGTFKLATAYPDLFARGHATVGSALPHWVRLPSLRNVPMLMWNAVADELVPVAEPLFDYEEAQRYGLRLELDLFPTADHLLLALNDQYGPGADFLGEHRVDPDPAFVTYMVNPMDHAHHMHLGLNADHAYWLSDMTVRTDMTDDSMFRDTLNDGRVDARSYAFGIGDSPRLLPANDAAVLEGGTVGPFPYTRHMLEWGPAPLAPGEDRLDLTLVNLATITVDVARAKLTCDAEVNVETDGPTTVTLAGCNRVIQADAVSAPLTNVANRSVTVATSTAARPA